MATTIEDVLARVRALEEAKATQLAAAAAKADADAALASAQQSQVTAAENSDKADKLVDDSRTAAIQAVNDFADKDDTT